MSKRLSEIMAREQGLVKVNPSLDSESVPIWNERGDKQTFHEYQVQAWNATERYIIAVAGTRSGKTRLGAHWLLREIARTARAGEDNHYLIVGPDTKLLSRAAIPTFSRLVKSGRPDGWAQYKQNEGCYVFSDEGAKAICGFVCDIRVYIGYATKPESLEAATYKAVWADECGQPDFVRESWEAIRRRISLDQARVIFTTTPYTVTGWFRELCDKAEFDDKFDARLIRFKTIANPLFPQEEWEAAKDLPEWKFKMFYEGVFTRPAGAIYDCFGDDDVVEPFEIPASWPRYVGLDFGDVNTAALGLAESPEGTLYVYSEYHTGGRTAEEHVSAIRRKIGQEPYLAVGGTWTGEDPAWRTEFCMAGLEVARPSLKEVEAGIDRVYRQFKVKGLKIFSTCTRTVSDVQTYSREVDDNAEPTEKIADRHKFHLADALRYIVATIRTMDGGADVIGPQDPESKKPRDEERELYERNTRILMEEEEDMPKTVVMRKVV